jgi:ATP-dependent RNA helicase MSS116, mitochondrial
MVSRVAQAKTGTGKTLAFLIPIIQRMIDESPDLGDRASRAQARPDDIRGIIISPTRELAEQIAAEAKSLARFTSIMVHTAVGGSNKSAMLRDLQRRGCHLLVATPGRLLDLLEDGRSGVDAPKLAAVVLDEADRMLDVGFANELENIMRLLPNPAEKERQTLLFSATIPKSVVGLTKKMVRRDQFEFVQTVGEDEMLTHERIPQNIAVADSISHLWPTLYELLDREIAAAADPEKSGGMPFKAIVYLPTTAMVQLAADVDYIIRRNDPNRTSRVPGFYIHGRLTQERRTRASTLFRNATSGILFSSDVTARGLDFPNVSHVIQVGAPPDRDQYIHRLGRTGRQDKAGEGWLLIPRHEVAGARSDLGGLPIKPDKSLASATADISTAEIPQIAKLKAAFSNVQRHVLVETYEASFGRMDKRNAQAVLDQMNAFSRDMWGWEKPPHMNPRQLQKRGLEYLKGWNTEDEGHSPRRSQSDNPFSSLMPGEEGDIMQDGGFGGGGFNNGRSDGRRPYGRDGGGYNRRGGGRDGGSFGGGYGRRRDDAFGGGRGGGRFGGRGGGGRGGGGRWGNSSGGEQSFGDSHF